LCVRRCLLRIRATRCGVRAAIGQKRLFKGRQFTAEGSSGRSAVPPVPYQLPRSRSHAVGSRRPSRPPHRLPVDPGLCGRIGEADTAASAGEQRLLAGRPSQTWVACPASVKAVDRPRHEKGGMSGVPTKYRLCSPPRFETVSAAMGVWGRRSAGPHLCLPREDAAALRAEERHLGAHRAGGRVGGRGGDEAGGVAAGGVVSGFRAGVIRPGWTWGRAGRRPSFVRRVSSLLKSKTESHQYARLLPIATQYYPPQAKTRLSTKFVLKRVCRFGNRPFTCGRSSRVKI
jgi:hypothetical protein